ncbi:MAG: Tat pathway signal protein [Phycisphaerales bacterium]|nr:Tat pathway signal protein [Phycisphaerales bacterium]
MAADPLVSRRPPVEKRTFRSEAVDALIDRVKPTIADPELAWLFENCFANTLDTTVQFEVKDGKPDTFVITGDIPALWLRDSSAQMQPFIALCKDDAKLSQMIAGLIRRQAACIRLDPYANAFFKDASEISHWKTDLTLMKPGVHERKWELDSLCYPIRLAHQYWAVTHDATVFDADWRAAMRMAVDTMVDQQRKTGPGAYTFWRPSRRRPTTAPADMFGPPFKVTGMICSNFRASDDVATYLFNIPENLFAVASLRQLADMLDELKDTSDLAKRSRTLSDEVEAAVLAHGIVDAPGGGKIYAYEVDGLGHSLLMDDANLPNLTSLPYFGYKTVDDPLYQRTRAFAQSPANPFFFKGTTEDGSPTEGVGSPHTSGPKALNPMIWPMGITARAMTSNDDAEIRRCLAMLKATHAGTGFMHESFAPSKPTRFSREWFAWANTLFGELILKLHNERPGVLKGP